MVAHSGGLDSTALLRLLWEKTKAGKTWRLGVFHVNYGLRGAAADEDEGFSVALAAELGLPFACRRVTAEERETRPGQGVQAWARALRRAEFTRLAADGWIVALAHHLDDQAETVLLRLARGAAPGRLIGMVPWAPPLWRPLLNHRKADLKAYLAALGQPYREDGTNGDSRYARNAVRHQVLPVLEALYPKAAERIVACAAEAREVLHPGATPGLPATGEHPQLSRRLLAGLFATAMSSPAPASSPAAMSGPVLAARRPRATDLPGDLGIVHKTSAGDLAVTPRSSRPVKAKRAAQHARALAGPAVSAQVGSGSHAFLRCPGGCWAVHRDLTSESGQVSAPLKVVLDGANTVPVAPGGGKSECSQPGVNLRYLRDGAFP
jgi:tRNA(Ile)-lysidine synthetase-like protein